MKLVKDLQKWISGYNEVKTLADEPELGALRASAEVKAGSARLFAGIFTRLIGFCEFVSNNALCRFSA